MEICCLRCPENLLNYICLLLQVCYVCSTAWMSSLVTIHGRTYKLQYILEIFKITRPSTLWCTSVVIHGIAA